MYVARMNEGRVSPRDKANRDLVPSLESHERDQIGGKDRGDPEIGFTPEDAATVDEQ